MNEAYGNPRRKRTRSYSISGRRKGIVYVIDIDPTSKTYNKHVLTLYVDDAGQGFRDLSVTPDGNQLVLGAPDVAQFAPNASLPFGPPADTEVIPRY